MSIAAVDQKWRSTKKFRDDVGHSNDAVKEQAPQTSTLQQDPRDEQDGKKRRGLLEEKSTGHQHSGRFHPRAYQKNALSSAHVIARCRILPQTRGSNPDGVISVQRRDNRQECRPPCRRRAWFQSRDQSSIHNMKKKQDHMKGDGIQTERPVHHGKIQPCSGRYTRDPTGLARSRNACQGPSLLRSSRTSQSSATKFADRVRQ